MMLLLGKVRVNSPRLAPVAWGEKATLKEACWPGGKWTGPERPESWKTGLDEVAACRVPVAVPRFKTVMTACVDPPVLVAGKVIRSPLFRSVSEPLGAK